MRAELWRSNDEGLYATKSWTGADLQALNVLAVIVPKLYMCVTSGGPTGVACMRSYCLRLYCQGPWQAGN